MLNEKRFQLGLFVLTGMTLLIATLVIHGIKKSSADSIDVYTVFDESVQGLDIGADFKYKGVKLGHVSNISIYDHKYIKVSLQIQDNNASDSLSNLDIEKHHITKEQIYSFLQKEIQNGISCKLTMAGITGLKYIELDYTEKQKSVLDLNIKDVNFIPSSKGTLDETFNNIHDIFQEVSKMDFEGISNELVGTLKTIQETLNKPQIETIMTQLAQTSVNMNKFTEKVEQEISRKKIESILTYLENTFSEVETLSKKLNSEVSNLGVSKLSTEAVSTLKSIQETTHTLNKSLGQTEKEIMKISKGFNELVGNLNKLKQEFNQYGGTWTVEGKLLIGKLKTTLDSVKDFFELIEKDPGAILHGKSIKD
jgi:ABC-type transporter Mla subunit MlaD